MAPRASSRVYSSSTLEAWFDKVGTNWEARFAESALRRGREIYRGGLISGLELGEGDAIVHCGFSRKETYYAVIEWGNDGPSVRFSTEDESLGQAVAVGGLYEIEELIADEIEPLPPSESEPEEPGDAEAEKPGDASAEEDEGTAGAGRKARRLAPVLEGRRSGLRLTARWVDAEGRRTPAFRAEGGALTSAEREALVRLTGRAKEAGFAYRKEACDFLLANVERIAPFFSHTVPRWEAVFGAIEMDDEASRMAAGVRAVRIVGKAAAAPEGRMRLDWRARLGREWLEKAEMDRLAKAGSGTHIVRGLGLVRLSEEQAEALAEWRANTVDAEGAPESCPRYMVFSLFAERGAELDLEEELRRWREALLPEGETDGSRTAPPGELPGFLREYQRAGVRWMANLARLGCHGLLADEMGLGKTLQVLTLLRYFPCESLDALIVCPASVVPVWRDEAAHWYPELQTEILRSGNLFSGARSGEPKVWIASYTQLRRHKHLLEQREFGYAVLDEAQLIKNPEAKISQACCTIRARSRFALTGTPLENRLLDLWTIFRFLMPGLLGSRRRFEEAALAKDAEVREAFEKRLRRQIAPFVLRREKDKVGEDLPDKVEMDLVCPITDTQRQIYDGLLARGREELGDNLPAAVRDNTMHFFTLLTRLRQACCDPGLVPGCDADIQQSGKVRILLTRLNEALSGDGARKVVIFSQFVTLLKRLKRELRREFPKTELYELTGATRDRAKPVAGFQEGGGPAVMLVSLKAGGTGVTLHAADYVFLLDPWWNPAVENQAVDRVHRIGQHRRVFVYRMVTEDTIEARMQSLKTEKRALFEQTLGQLDGGDTMREHFVGLEELAELLAAE